LDSNTLTRVFLTPAEANSSVVALLLPLLIIIVVAGVLSVVLPGLFFRGQSARVPVDYGIAGGAVCRRCNLPYPRHPWAPNMVTGKLERCPHCGKWGTARRAAPAELALAEVRLMGKDSDTGASARSESEEEGLRHQIEESRYE
jgi:hypothetical protein